MTAKRKNEEKIFFKVKKCLFFLLMPSLRARRARQSRVTLKWHLFFLRAVIASPQGAAIQVYIKRSLFFLCAVIASPQGAAIQVYIKRCLFFLILSSCLTACATSRRLEEGRTFFHTGNYTQAMERLAPLAKQGNADAQYALGYLYYYGKGTPVNKPLAKKWITAAAAQGEPDAILAARMIKRQEQEASLHALPLMLQPRGL